MLYHTGFSYVYTPLIIPFESYPWKLQQTAASVSYSVFRGKFLQKNGCEEIRTLASYDTWGFPVLTG